MTVPFLGPLALSGFAHAWYFLYLLVVLGLVAAYVVVQYGRHRRVLRFANMEVLQRVAPTQNRRRWRHVPAVLLVMSLATLAVALAAPTHDVRIPRNRAVVMLVIDVSESMVATDVAPNRLEAAKEAGKQFADELTPGINLGLVAFGGSATLLVSPTTNRAAMKNAIDGLKAEERTATGEGIFTALQAIASVDAVMGGGDTPAPAHIVLESDGAETIPRNPDEPRGAYTAARAAKDQGVAISTISFGTPDGVVTIDGQQIPVPVDDATLQQITDISGGQTYHASSLEELKKTYSELQQQIGYETIRGDASQAWIRVGAVLMALAVLTSVVTNQRVPV
ncbi:VWA domain-containing protein [Mycobacterium yunnanensis]|uniref:VWA domain-containing protein n=1 Tax=Mycobacterium yunnanensis TaxID=368477 RepID=A0A9X2ZAQ0_9MYCO|nr:VWA domain-containing protein [Mycobacterium yunnanensis]MCV7424824.1 VWA domain-containing protein [Mycobacterium yunnanensis]